MSTTARPARRPRRRNPDLETLVTTALEDMKAVNIKKLDVRGQTDVADAMIIASGNSDRHVRAIAEHVVEAARAAGHRPFGVEGRRDSEWVLVDLQDVLVHVMLPRTREFYALEQLWEAPVARPARAARVPAAKKAAASGTRPAARKRTAADGGKTGTKTAAVRRPRKPRA